MKSKPNEDDAIKRFIDILNITTEVNYKVETKPDNINRNKKDVDGIICSNKKARIAIEHTILESFDRQIEYANEHFRIIKAVREKCKSNLPNNHYYDVSVSDELILGKTKSEKERLINALSVKIPLEVVGLKNDSYKVFQINGKDITIECLESAFGMNKEFVPIIHQPKDHDKKFVVRLNRLMKKKLPKLITYKFKRYEAALLIEDVAALRSPNVIKSLSIKNKIMLLFVDYIIYFVSNENRMVVGNIWKNKRKIFNIVPYKYRFYFNK